MQQRQTIIEIRPLRAAGSVTTVPLSNSTGPATQPKRTHSITPLRPQNSKAANFAGSFSVSLRDNSKSGCSLFSESLAEKSFRHDNRCSSLGGIAQLVERLVRNEKVRGSNPLTSSLRAS